MMLLTRPAFVTALFLATSLAGEDEDDENRVIDLQDLLVKVSGTLESCEAQLARANLVCKERQSVAQDCSELFKGGERKSGVYAVQPLGYEEPFDVYCDMETAGGGWTVFQRRGDYGYPNDSFYRTWSEYKAGFGSLRKEFWLGNDRISALSLQEDYVLRVDVSTMNRKRGFALYSEFWIENEDKDYQLHVDKYSGNIGDSIIDWHNDRPFSTKDKGPSTHCAQAYKGGWWYNNCHASNLNGLNLKGNTTTYADGIVWYTYKEYHYSLYSEMKMRPVGF